MDADRRMTSSLAVDSGRWLLRSAAVRTCIIYGFGDKSFPAAGRPRTWNDLPSRLRQDIRIGRSTFGIRAFIVAGPTV